MKAVSKVNSRICNIYVYVFLLLLRFALDNATTEVITDTFRPFATLLYQMNPDWSLPSNFDGYQGGDHWRIYTTSRVNKVSFWMYQRLFNLLKDKQVARLTLVVLQTDAFEVVKFYQYVINQFSKSNKLCYALVKINTSESNQIVNFLRNVSQDVTMRYYQVFGSIRNQINLVKMAIDNGITDRTWLLNEVSEVDYTHKIPENTTIISFIDPKISIFHYIENKLSTSQKNLTKVFVDKFYSTLKLQYVSSLCSRKMMSLYIAFIRQIVERIWADKPKLEFEYYTNQFFIYMFSNSITRSPYRLLSNNAGKTERNLIIFYRKLIDNITCRKPVCARGWHDFHGLISIPEHKKWDTFFGWSCKKCPGNTFKTQPGSGICKQCPNMTLSENNRHTCYDPFRTLYNSYDRMNVRICLSLSVIGIVICVTMILTFLKFKETPLVRAADFKISVCHFMCCLLIFTCLPILFFLKPTNVICYARPVFVSALNCSCAAIFLIKSNRILTVFRSKLRIDESDANKLKIVQFFIVFLYNGIGIFFVCITIHGKIPKVIGHIDLINYTKDLSCNTDYHVTIQVCYLLTLQISPAVQAFRGRNLPGPFNEAMSIIYATFVTVVAYSTMVPVYKFQKVHSDKATIQCFVIMLVAFLQVIVLYGKKIFIIWFQPQKNTKAYVRNKLQNKTLLELRSVK